jgi:hypothetical protein
MAVEQEKRGSYFSDQDLVLAVYVLYLASFITGFTGIIGVVIAHVKIGSADALSATPAISNSNILDWAVLRVCGFRARVHFGGLPRSPLVVRLDLGARHQRHDPAERSATDRASVVLAVRISPPILKTRR